MAAHLLDAYPQQYPLARTIARQHHFFLGPTNSGKTWHALETLSKAESGVYLAPLRLLAMEVRDRLVAAGVPCNLITGEERVLMAGARHTASTIEMMRPDWPVDVAVIDEIQMLQDPDRGSAWTAALIGVPAQQVFICGSNAVTAPCIAALEALQEPYQITYLERKTPLVIEEQAICGQRYHKSKLKSQLQRGDAMIAFSRKDVLTLSARIRQWGFRVASIYGALSPEVRRAESERFNTGEADILVATDAIGMGLNLPIRRIVFSSLTKFDGVANRLLNATEVRQIAGRAGRFGLYETGYVNVMEAQEQLDLHHLLNTDDTVPLTALPMALPYNALFELGQAHHSRRLAELLETLHQHTQKHSPLYALASIDALLQQATLIDAHAPDMALKDKYIFACAPISLTVPIERDYYLLCLETVYLNRERRLPPLPDWIQAQNPSHLIEAEQLSQQLSLYAWLSFKYPKHFIEASMIAERRTQLSLYIQRSLQVQPGFGDTLRELDQWH